MYQKLSDYTSHPVFTHIESILNCIPLYKRTLPLLKILVVLKNIPFTTKTDLYIATGKVERELDTFFIKTIENDYHETVYIKAMIEIINEYERNPPHLNELLHLVSLCIKH